ncbi:TfuA-like protein [Aliirhizobium smilacinae]|uniref:Antibiotic resistance protein n=1 Tax=Aliirhizobium smilacinae TaxID=1395944 RepID=A0A5C4XQ22_9HYPH|nr:TfuA-like protein [Rhizobium smilacinae]TNM65359.1 antibiotic resistance protein [Rhizobium smilacinae]
MKVLFAGPSLPDARDYLLEDIQLRPPAAKGDVYRAIVDGATVIGLIDGYFEQTAAVWHKEILFALSRGVTVMGAASMGALRAVECARYGMIGIGKIFERFRLEHSMDDADVAQVHGPPETGYIALSEPLVNIVFTLHAWLEQNLVSAEDADELRRAAQACYFKDRTWRRVILATRLFESRQGYLLALARDAKVNQKRLDALELIHVLLKTNPSPCSRVEWTFQSTAQWKMATSKG